jgi:putative ABC transport system ATP-binding protein
MTLLALEDIHKNFVSVEGTVPVLQGVSLSVANGEVVALTGESGSGKSTLLHITAGLEPADSGRVLVAGTDMAALPDAGRATLRRGTVGLVFQQFNLVPSLTVAANLSFQARLCGQHDPALCQDLAARLGLDGVLARYPEQLSGGQQQRVAIGRALAARPKVLLADEPTGNLDETTGDAVFALMLELARAQDTGLLLVTHSLRLAEQCDRRVHLRAGRVA